MTTDLERELVDLGDCLDVPDALDLESRVVARVRAVPAVPAPPRGHPRHRAGRAGGQSRAPWPRGSSGGEQSQGDV